MTEPEIDRSLIAAAREGLGPTPADRARLRRAVLAAVTGGVVAGTAGAATSASAMKGAAGAIGAWSLSKVTILATAVAAVVGGTVYVASEAGMRDSDGPRRSVAADFAREHRRPQVEDTPSARASGEFPAPTSSAPTSSGPASAGPASAIPTSERPADLASFASASTTEASSAHPAEGMGPAAHAEQRTPAPRSSPPAPSSASPEPAPAAPAEVDPVLEEARLIRLAVRALHEHDPARALAWLEEHRARFPDGSLREERLATRILALCDAGQTSEARREASLFLASHPGSVQAARVRASCAAP